MLARAPRDSVRASSGAAVLAAWHAAGTDALGVTRGGDLLDRKELIASGVRRNRLRSGRGSRWGVGET